MYKILDFGFYFTFVQDIPDRYTRWLIQATWVLVLSYITALTEALTISHVSRTLQMLRVQNVDHSVIVVVFLFRSRFLRVICERTVNSIYVHYVCDGN